MTEQLKPCPFCEQLVQALKNARFNVAYVHHPENCGDHCRNNCSDCVLKNTLDDLDAAITTAERNDHGHEISNRVQQS